MSRTPMMAGNWKMNLNHLEAIQLVQKLAFGLDPADFEAVEVVVVPPFTDLRSVQTLVDGDKLMLKYGAQDLSPHASGAYTGDIGGPMLAKLGCSYVVVGHSERRQYHHEDDTVVRSKVAATFEHAMVPILCVGEGLDIRKAGEHVAHTIAQVTAAVEGLSDAHVAKLVTAYEPVWAIGTGEVATPEDAQEVCSAIRARIAELYSGKLAEGMRVLYGGSVKSSSIAGLMAMPDVDGGLVGGASLDGEEFAAIVRGAKG